MSSIVDYVKNHVDPNTYYKSKFPQWDGHHNSNVECPFLDKHEKGTDNRPSFSLNINQKGGCFCHSCGTKVGNIIHFHKLTTEEKDVDDEKAASHIYNEFVRPVICSPEEVSKVLQPFDTALKGSPKKFVSLQKEVQISAETAKRFDLGWDAKANRVTIPIFDSFNQLVNVRYYRLPSMRQDDKYPKILNEEGFGTPPAMFPIPQLFTLCRSKHKPPIIFWMTGERDTLKAWDDGIASFCYTAGEQVLDEAWADAIKGLKTPIGIVQPNEKAGKEGAIKRHKFLSDNKIPCFIIDLDGEDIKDYSDFRREGGTVQEFLEYAHEKVNETPSPAPTPITKNGTKKDKPSPKEKIPIPKYVPSPPGGEYHTIPRIVDPTTTENKGEFPVSDIGHNPELLNCPIKVRAIVSGRHERTYSVPWIIEMGGARYKIPVSREILQLVRQNDDEILKLMNYWLNTKAKIKIEKYITVMEVEIIPMIQPGVDSIYVNQRCYFFGSNLECNKPYMMTIVPTTDMKTQETIGLILDIEHVSNILDSYKFDAESYELLSSEFHAPEDTSILENLRSLAHSISVNHTGISHRDDLHLAALLTWISPLQFDFPFEGVQRGWLNTLVLGDTETGKSQVCRKLTQLFQCGAFINSESCSYVGLVGGAVKSSSGMFILRWGKIPLYNRQLVVMEELSGLSTTEISHMSDIRSSGVARYDKAGLTGETSAKTRLICLSNVRGEGKSLSDYNTGVQAAQGLVGHNEDLARFDLMLTAIDDEVDAKIINRDRSTEEKQTFSPVELKAFKELVMFAWSLKVDQINFSMDAYKMCLEETLRMCKIYHASLPIFKAGSGRLKLARLAVAIACLQFAWSEEKQQLLVGPAHVQAAAQLLEHFYKKPSLGYARYSNIQYNLQKINNEPDMVKLIETIFKGKTKDFYRYISHNLSFTKFDVADALGIHAMYIERTISSMFLANVLKKAEERNEWQLSKAGRGWTERQLNKDLTFDI